MHYAHLCVLLHVLFYRYQCHTAKIATNTGLEHIFPDKGAGEPHIPGTRGSTAGQQVKHAWLLKELEGSQMQVNLPQLCDRTQADTIAQRLDVRFKYLLAIIFIDSQWSWTSGPRKVFDHLCIPILKTLRLPDLKSMHSRQVLERMMRKRQCQALEVRKSTSDSGAVVEGESSLGRMSFIARHARSSLLLFDYTVFWHSKMIGQAIRLSKQAALEMAAHAALDWYRDPANAGIVAVSCQCSSEVRLTLRLFGSC